MKREAFQTPVDSGEWGLVTDLAEDDKQTGDDEPKGYRISGDPKDPNDPGVIWAEKPSQEEIDNERLKIGLRHQHHEEHFGGDDPSVSDDELWSAYQRALGKEEE